MVDVPEFEITGHLSIYMFMHANFLFLLQVFLMAKLKFILQEWFLLTVCSLRAIFLISRKWKMSMFLVVVHN